MTNPSCWDAHPADAILPVLVPFATLFSNPTWREAQVLLVGAILAPGQRKEALDTDHELTDFVRPR